MPHHTETLKSANNVCSISKCRKIVRLWWRNITTSFWSQKVLGKSRKQRGTLTVICNLNESKHAKLGCSAKPYEDQNPSTCKTSIRTSKKTKHALMLLRGGKSVIILNILHNTRIQWDGAYSQPATKNPLLLRMRETSMRELLLVTPTNCSPLLCPRINDLPHRAKTLPQCTRIFSWSADST